MCLLGGMQWLAARSGKRGRSATFSDAAIQFCLSIKSLFPQPFRPALGVVQSLLCLIKLRWLVLDFSTVCRRQKSLQTQLSQPSTLTLNPRRFGRQLCKNLCGYYRHGLLETKMHGFKPLGERVTAHTFERQFVELHVRVALLNFSARPAVLRSSQRRPWHESVWLLGHAVRESVWSTKPF